MSEIFNHSDTCAVPSVRNAVGLLSLLKLCPVLTFLQQLMTKGLWVIHTYTCSPMFSIDVVVSAPYDPCTTTKFADSRIALLCHALRICVAHAPPESCPFPLLVHWAYRAELVIEIPLSDCTTPPCHKIDLFKRPFQGSCFERLDDAFVLLISLIFLYPQKILISVKWPFEL